MKKIQYLLGCCILSLVVACSTNSESNEESLADNEKKECCEKSCTKKGDEKCSSKKSSCSKSGKYDAEMESVCQNACGVSEYDENDIVGNTMASIGDVTTCPVSGAIFKIKENGITKTSNDVLLNFCCETCSIKFDENPEKFIKNI